MEGYVCAGVCGSVQEYAGVNTICRSEGLRPLGANPVRTGQSVTMLWTRVWIIALRFDVYHV